MGGQGGYVPPEIPTLKRKFLGVLGQHVIAIVISIYVFSFRGASPPNPHWGSAWTPLGDFRPHPVFPPPKQIRGYAPDRVVWNKRFDLIWIVVGLAAVVVKYFCKTEWQHKVLTCIYTTRILYWLISQCIVTSLTTGQRFIATINQSVQPARNKQRHTISFIQLYILVNNIVNKHQTNMVQILKQKLIRYVYTHPSTFRRGGAGGPQLRILGKPGHCREGVLRSS